MRIAPNQAISTPPIPYGAAQSEQVLQLGTAIEGVPGDPTATASQLNPAGRLIYVKFAGDMVVGAPAVLDKDWNLVALPNTADTGRPVVIAASLFSAANPYGWAMETGQGPVKVSAASAAGASLFISGAGTVSDVAANGKQILGMWTTVASTGSFTKTSCVTKVNSTQVQIPTAGMAGLFAGLAVSGTGIAGGTTIADLDNGSGNITLSAAATASGSVTLTFTYTGYVGAQWQSPHVQGRTNA